MEWEHSDGLVITQWEDEEISGREIGATLEQLRAMQQKGQGQIEHKGVRYRFVDSAQATCYENDGVDGARFQSWMFEAEDGERLLSVMHWPGTDDGCSGRLGWYLSEDEVELV